MGPAPVRVESSAIEWVTYEPARRRLHVAFKGGRAYAYLDVPPEAYAALLAAESKGRFVNAQIKPRYAVERE